MLAAVIAELIKQLKEIGATDLTHHRLEAPRHAGELDLFEPSYRRHGIIKGFRINHQAAGHFVSHINVPTRVFLSNNASSQGFFIVA